MPWDATRLRVAAFEPDGTLGESALAAGGPDESIVQPEWSPDGTLHFVSDRTGWWNLYRLVEGPRLEPLAPMEAEFADPAWIFDRSSYGFLADGAIVAVARSGGRDHLYRIEPGLLVGEVEMPFTELDALRVGEHTVVALAGRPGDPAVVARFDPVTLAPAGVLRRASTVTIDPAAIAEPESIEFPTTGGRTAHALYYAPTNPAFAAPDGERPPLLVLSHGGPTANASTSLDLGKQLLTSRGIAVVDVDYGGSTGYGRDYRRRLEAQWGVVDVDDCVAAARFLVERGDVDRERLAIEGGSAGGYTTLAALAFRDVFAAGISLFGIGDLERCSRRQPTSSSRATTTAWSARIRRRPRCTASARRSTSWTGSRARCSSSRASTTRSSRRPRRRRSWRPSPPTGIPHAYIAFEGEGHGFRGADAIRRTHRGPAVVPRPGLRVRPGRRARAARGARPRDLARPPPPPGVRRHRGIDRDLMELSPIELVLGLFVVAVALAYVARRIGVAYPILLVLGGLALGLVPGVPTIVLDPSVVFLLLLPPILFGAGYSTPIRDFKANLRPIVLLAVGLVLFTTVVVGVVAQLLIPELAVNAGAAFALGAIVAPPDAVAATAIFRRLGVPRRVVTILEGESLINDATALIAYRFAVAVAIGGDLLVAAGRDVVRVRRPRRDRRRGRRRLHPDRGLAADERPDARDHDLAARPVRGLPAGRGPRRERGPGRGRGRADRRTARRAGPVAGRAADGPGVWDIVTFIINSFAFMLIGLQLPSILAHLDLPGPTLIAYGLAISLIVIVARIVWVFPATYLPRRLSKSHPGARPERRRRRPSSSSRGRACAAPSPWPPPWPCRSTSGSRSATWSSS